MDGVDHEPVNLRRPWVELIASLAMAIGFVWFLFSDDPPVAVMIAFGIGLVTTTAFGVRDITRRRRLPRRPPEASRQSRSAPRR